jgi:hypothetical protein
VDNATWREGLFEKFDSLVEILICEAKAEVPENNKLLRCFQFISAETVSVGDYCWNGECANCRVWYKTDAGETKSALACRMYVEPGLIITQLSDSLKTDLA